MLSQIYSITGDMCNSLKHGMRETGICYIKAQGEVT